MPEGKPRRNYMPNGTTLREKLEFYSERTAGGCVVWIGYRDGRGYGRVAVGYEKKLAHRMSFEEHRAPIPPGAVINHICRNRSCINPDHLETVSQARNAQFVSAQSGSELPRGVYLEKRTGRYLAKAQLRGQMYYFGSLDGIAEAEAAAVMGRDRIGMHNPKLEEENAVSAPEPADAEELPAQLS